MPSITYVCTNRHTFFTPKNLLCLSKLMHAIHVWMRIFGFNFWRTNLFHQHLEPLNGPYRNGKGYSLSILPCPFFARLLNQDIFVYYHHFVPPLLSNSLTANEEAFAVWAAVRWPFQLCGQYTEEDVQRIYQTITPSCHLHKPHNRYNQWYQL